MKFSVVIPTYSRIPLLEKAIESAAKQTFHDFEIVVVNDNPAEKRKIDLLVARFDKAKVIHHEFPKGGNAARNTGILHAQGELIAFLDDDDIWLPEKLALHFKEHEQNPKAGLVFSDCLYIYDSKKVAAHVYSPTVPGNIIDAMGNAKFCPATSSIVSITRSAVQKCGLFDENLVSFQDWDYWFRIAHEFEFAHIPVVLVNFRQHLGDRTSHNEEKRRKGLSQIVNKWGNRINIDAFSRTFMISIYYKNSRNLLLSGNKLGAFKKSLKLFGLEVLSINSVKSFVKLSLDLIK